MIKYIKDRYASIARTNQSPNEPITERTLILFLIILSEIRVSTHSPMHTFKTLNL